MSDGTGRNPSDPNSMIDLGGTRNTIYNYQIQGVPSIKETKFSKALNVNNPGKTNNTFYAFGAQHTNIKDQLISTFDTSK